MKKGKLGKRIRPRLGSEFALVSRRNRVLKDRKKEESKMKCRRPVL